VPQVSRVFAQAKQQLPLPTRVLIGMAAFVTSYGWLVLVAAAVAAWAGRRAMRVPSSRRRFELLLYRLPGAGVAVRDIAVARFAQTLATMVAGGLPLVESLRIARASCGSLTLGDTIAAAETAVFEGGSLASCLATTPLIDPVVVDMIGVGERSGDLEGMLGHAAAAIEDQVAARVDQMATLLEPAMTVIMAAFVLFIILAIMLPVLDMNRLVH